MANSVRHDDEIFVLVQRLSWTEKKVGCIGFEELEAAASGSMQKKHGVVAGSIELAQGTAMKLQAQAISAGKRKGGQLQFVRLSYCLPGCHDRAISLVER